MPLIRYSIAGDDTVPQPPVLDDGDFWGGLFLRGVAVTVMASLPAQALAADDDLPTPPAVATIVDEDQALIAAPWASPALVQPFLDDDVAPPQAAPQTIAEEDFWTAALLAQPALAQFAFADPDDLPVTVAAAPIVQEDFWIPPPASAPWIAVAFVDTDDIVPQPAPGQPDEDFLPAWLGPPHVPAALYQRMPYLPDPEEIPAGSLVAPPPPATRVYAIFVFDD